MNVRRSWLAIWLVGIGICCGCSASDSAGGEKLHPVKGKVLVNGKPAVYALVTLRPKGQPVGSATPFGRVDKDGSFQITTRAPNDGAPAGEYGVTISWCIPVNPNASEIETGPELLPPRYQDPEQSGLQVVVKDGTNELPPFTIVK